MKTHPQVLTPQALAVAAGRKTRRVQKKLHEAEDELHSANEVLAHPGSHDRKEVDEAVQRNSDAERKVHEAVEELEVVKEMLDHADPHHGQGRPAVGRSGHGVKSLMPHLRHR